MTKNEALNEVVELKRKEKQALRNAERWRYREEIGAVCRALSRQNYWHQVAQDYRRRIYSLCRKHRL